MPSVPPPPPVTRRPVTRRTRPPGSWPGIAIALAVGLVTESATGGPPGIGLLLVAFTAAFGLIALTTPRPAALPFLGGGLVLMSFVVVRASMLVDALDTLGALCLFAAGASYAREGAPAVSTVRGYAARVVAVIGELPAGLSSLMPPVSLAGNGAGARRIPTTALIVVPVVGVLAILLGTADPVFAHLLTAPAHGVHVGSLPLQLVVVVAGAAAFAVLAARARRPVTLGPLETTIDLGGTPAGGSWVPLLVSVDLLFAAFVVVQFAYFFGGRTRVLTEQGLTFAEYARSGFWQLVAAAIITGGVISFSWIAGGRERSHRNAFRWLAGTLVLLDLVVLASAFRRLTLYEDTFGWTWPRLSVHVTILAGGVLLICALIAVVTGRVAWLPTAAVVVATLALIGFSAIDPDAFIAQRNLERYARTGDLDVNELRSLSADAVPALADAYPSLDACAREQVARLFEETARSVGDSGWASWNLGRERAVDAIDLVALLPSRAVPFGCG